MFQRRSCPPVPPRKGGLWKAGAGVGCTHIRCGGLDPILQTASDFIAQSNDRFRLKAVIQISCGNVEMNDRKRPRAVIPRRPSGHATTKSLWLKRMDRLFEKQGQGWQFQAPDQLRSERDSECQRKRRIEFRLSFRFLYTPPTPPLALPFQSQRSSIR